MLKKALAVLTFAALAFVAVPSAADAAGYVPNSNVTVTGNAVSGGTVTVNFAGHSFASNESVAVSVNGSTTTTLSVVKAAVLASFTKQATATGSLSVNVAFPANASGTYTLTATGMTSGNVGTASMTIVPASNGNLANTGSTVSNSSGNLANTGATLPMLMIWIGSGALILGVAIVGTLTFVRRKRRTA